MAALTETDHAALGAADADHLGRPTMFPLADPLATGELACDHCRHAVAKGQIGQQFFQPLGPVFDQCGLDPIGRDIIQTGAECIQGAVEHARAQAHRILMLQILQEVPERRARVAGDDELGAVMISTV
jgi:hypothetical protein